MQQCACLNVLVKTAGKGAETCESSSGRPPQLALNTSESYARKGTGLDNDFQSKSLETLPRTWNRSNDKRRQSSAPSSRDKILYCSV